MTMRRLLQPFGLRNDGPPVIARSKATLQPTPVIARSKSTAQPTPVIASRKAAWQSTSPRLVFVALLLTMNGAMANGVETLREFVRDTRSGQAQFTQTVTSADGVRKKTSSGTFEFQRPNRFRFHYLKPFEQLLVADGSKVWMHDPELNQVSARKLDQVLGSTPAALLAGGSLDKDFELTVLPSRDGLDWVQAMPRQRESAVQGVKVAFKGKVLWLLEMTDSFGQKSTLQFADFQVNPTLPAQTFKFVPPRGADVVEQ